MAHTTLFLVDISRRDTIASELHAYKIQIDCLKLFPAYAALRKELLAEAEKVTPLGSDYSDASLSQYFQPLLDQFMATFDNGINQGQPFEHVISILGTISLDVNLALAATALIP
jgi:hypothetical protein